MSGDPLAMEETHMPAWLVAALPYIVSGIQQLLTLLAHGVSTLPAGTPAAAHLADAQANLTAAHASLTKAMTA